MQTLISADELAAALADAAADRGGRIRLLDVRWQLGGPPGRPEYRAGHLPGAAYVDLDDELAGHGEPADGRHPLPDIAVLQAAARGWGLNDGDTVVVYDDLGSLSAARAWWLLRHAGVRDVRLLDGSLAAWRAAGLPIAAGDEAIPPAASPCRTDSCRPSTRMPPPRCPQPAACCSTPAPPSATAATPSRSTLGPATSRARSARRRPRTSAPTGDSCPPARCAPGSNGWASTDAAAVGVYCGSGVTAAHQAAALAIAGFPAALYPGSWSQWSNLPGRPVATGAGPEALPG